MEFQSLEIHQFSSAFKGTTGVWQCISPLHLFDWFWRILKSYTDSQEQIYPTFRGESILKFHKTYKTYWVSVTTLRKSSVLHDFEMMHIFTSRVSGRGYIFSHRKFIKYCYASCKVVTLTHCEKGTTHSGPWRGYFRHPTLNHFHHVQDTFTNQVETGENHHNYYDTPLQPDTDSHSHVDPGHCAKFQVKAQHWEPPSWALYSVCLGLGFRILETHHESSKLRDRPIKRTVFTILTP